MIYNKPSVEVRWSKVQENSFQLEGTPLLSLRVLEAVKVALRRQSSQAPTYLVKILWADHILFD